MPELKGKLETTYEWTCAACGAENQRLDEKQCACGKPVTDEKVLRHFRLTPEPIRLGIRV